MSLKSANEFILVTVANPDLMAKVVAAIAGKNPAEAALVTSELGKLDGFDFTADELLEARQAFLASQQLSDHDLDSVAGGTGTKLNPTEPTGGGIIMPPDSVGPISPVLSPNSAIASW